MISCSEEEYFYKFDSLVIQSTQYLRKIFKQRWKCESGEDWRDEPEYIEAFLDQHWKNILKKALPLQKKILFESCSLEDWDISLMSLVLLNFGDWKKYKLQNKAIRQLKDLRNDLAHHKSKRLPQNEYCEKLKMFKQSLQMLQINKSEVEKLVKESSVSSSFGDTERYKMMLKNAELLMKSQDFESALQKYFEAITTPNLSPVNLGEIYEKRAACHLSIKDSENIYEKHIDQAILDTEEALKLNSLSWNAYYLKAQCQKAKHNLPEAIRCYKTALAISPLQKQIKQDLDSCAILESMQRENSNLNLDKYPTSVDDIVGDNKYKCGHQISLKHYAELSGCQNDPVFLGNMYYDGLEVAQDYAKALQYYIEADKQGSAVGCSMVAFCYYHGHGVEQDVAKSIDIFKRCANTDPKKKRKFDTYSPLGFNKGVATAEYAIGKGYDHGIGVEENFSEAIIWYTRAMEHGHPDAACCLGHLYYEGWGVATDAKMAEMCWKQGLNLDCTSAAEYLVEYYRYQLELEMAWNMFRIGREMGNSRFLEMSDEDFNGKLAVAQSERCKLEKRLLEFEKVHNLEINGMTFRERVERTEEVFYLDYVQINGNKHVRPIQPVGLDRVFDSELVVVRKAKSVLERKGYLKSPVRRGFLLQHRERLRDVMSLKQHGLPFDKSVIPGKLQQKRAQKMGTLKCITLQEMNPTKDEIYENRILDLTIIEEPNYYSNSIQLIAEDDNGDTTRVYIDQVEAETGFMQRLEAGCRIAVINPYMGICAKGGVNGIRINEPKCIMYLDGVKNLCRLCGEENATRKFSKCKRLFCSKECQKLDLQLFGEKLVLPIVLENKNSKEVLSF